MGEGNEKINKILFLLKEKKGIDFSGYRESMLERRIKKRISATKCENYDDYLQFIHKYPYELEQLINVFTINVSNFFRNPLIFEYINKIILPELIPKKGNNLRIWSCGCANGEEPFSMSILINEYFEKEKCFFKVNIFATDLDNIAIKNASKGSYKYDSIKNIKYGLLNKYFTKIEEHFIIDNKIKTNVKFSIYDLINEKNKVPPESIFGGFDIVLCRNVLIYFNTEYQRIIFKKLYESLSKNGYLILGEAEVPVEHFKDKFERVCNCCTIYRKIG